MPVYCLSPLFLFQVLQFLTKSHQTLLLRTLNTSMTFHSDGPTQTKLGLMPSSWEEGQSASKGPATSHSKQNSSAPWVQQKNRKWAEILITWKRVFPVSLQSQQTLTQNICVFFGHVRLPWENSKLNSFPKMFLRLIRVRNLNVKAKYRKTNIYKHCEGFWTRTQRHGVQLSEALLSRGQGDMERLRKIKD